MLKHDKISPTFCVLPWMHLSAMPNGFAKMCCLSNEDLIDESGKIFSFESHTIKEIWNSKQMQEARRKMLSGEKLAACTQCYDEETLGTHSMRIGFTEKWLQQEPKEIEARISESKNNSSVLTSMPWYYDLRQGNLCNLKCRTCSPENSISIEKEYAEVVKTDPDFSQFIYQSELSDSYKNWFSSPIFSESFQEQLPNIKKLYFTGGEPALIEKNYEIMEYFVKNDLAKNIELMFSTNTTKLNDRFLDLISHFKFVLLNLSIDGYEAEQEYLRGGSSWKTIEAALHKLALRSANNIHLALNPVVQASNVLTIDKLFYYVESLNSFYKKNIFYFMPILLHSPAYLDFSILPRNTREEAIKKLVLYREKSAIIKYDSFFKKRLDQLIQRLAVDVSESKDLIKKFVFFNQVLDKKRNQKFQQTFPELHASWLKNSELFHQLNKEMGLL